RMQTVAFNWDGSRIVAVGWDGAIRLWNARSHQTLAVATAPYKLWSVAFSPDGRHIATGTGAYGGELQLWDTDTLKPDGEPLIGHSGWLLYSVGFSPDGARVVSGSNDHSLRVWDIKTRRQVAVMYGDENNVLSVAFAHHHPWIVSAAADGSVRLWNADTYQPIGMPFHGHRYMVNGVVFSPDETRILSGSADGDLRLWSTQTEETEIVCSKLSANMSHRQWHQWVSTWMPYTRLCPGLPVPQ
ncbi:MAG: WD40 repeat domain-containing protein, partial [Mycobacterium sp.]|nr:WD40 repeat domain-containing protein [Mycobacterium sp.]